MAEQIARREKGTTGSSRVLIYFITLSVVTWSLQLRLLESPWRLFLLRPAESAEETIPRTRTTSTASSSSNEGRSSYSMNSNASFPKAAVNNNGTTVIWPDFDFPIECKGKERWLHILFGAGKRADHGTNFVEICANLPTEEQIAELYGDGPVVYGLETCEEYRSLLLQKKGNTSNNGGGYRAMPRVAGLYNSGTNAMARAFQTNLRELINQGLTFTVPWGKHVPPKYRLVNTHPKENPDVKDLVLPIVLVRDPYRWMQSMCKESYDASWKKLGFRQCPNLVRNAATNETSLYNVSVTAEQTLFRYTDEYASLADMWTEWNRQYVEADFPRLIVRFEDTLYHAEEVMGIIKDCIGYDNSVPFKYYLPPAKTHGRATSFITALLRYASEAGRYQGMTKADLQYSRQALDPKLMDTFHYKVPSRKVDLKVDKDREFVTPPLASLNLHRPTTWDSQQDNVKWTIRKPKGSNNETQVDERDEKI